MITGITLILLSLIAIPSIILTGNKKATDLLDRIIPYQGWIGVTFTFWGLYGIITASISNIGQLEDEPLLWITLFIANITQIILGFTLAYGMISKYVFSRKESAKINGQQILAKLAPTQGKLGILGLCVGICSLLISYFFS